ncbi:PorP/SprF family type IX secretion system membrane protein [Aridibaculum aurantiacum]|uniref:PorP/SprF family type IX secretion system membrane protein n=1 Tax=Aridibaculum aurantiacum TaxID=2810307 RepID=UPI001A96A5F9|nr:PorP/SprF family type IX secretion system membrane protein [Aridibaculum aurantiacum]
MQRSTPLFYFLLFTLVATLFVGVQPVRSQVDPHFSQYYVYPMALNPALTGAIDGDYRVTAIYRNQWSGISSAFATPGLSADFTTGKNLNIGMNVMNQSAARGAYNYLNGYVSLAYTGLRFGTNGNHQVALALSGGIINRRFNPSKFEYGEQWNASTGYNPAAPSNDILNASSASTFDAGAGIAYFDGTPGKKANVFAGVSAFHLTTPTDPFSASGYDEKLPVRYAAHGGVKLAVADKFSLIPNVIYMRQGTAQEVMAGAYAQLSANEKTDLLLGANYRLGDAVSPFVGLYYQNMLLGLSYDVNTSNLGKMAGNASSFEISLSLFGKKKFTPERHHFICPRL